MEWKPNFEGAFAFRKSSIGKDPWRVFQGMRNFVEGRSCRRVFFPRETESKEELRSC